MLFFSRIRNDRRMALLRELDASRAINTAGQSIVGVSASGESMSGDQVWSDSSGG